MSATILPTKMPTTNPPTPASSAWNDQLLANPHEVADKRNRVQKMFAAIAPSYDLNNRLHSFWRDQAWRRKAVKLAQLDPIKVDPEIVVDVACGTGDLSLAFAKSLANRALSAEWRDVRSAFLAGKLKSLPSQKELQPHPCVYGLDFTFEMLPVACRKGQKELSGNYSKKAWGRKRVNDIVRWINGDAQSLPLPDASADVVSIAFGIRNVQSIPTALKEFRRILKPGGRVIILEFSKPTNPVLRVLNDFYCGKIMPITATLISGDKSGAYKYLPKSVDTFISREKMVEMMSAAGFTTIEQFPMTFGVCVCYRGTVA